ncbi:MAG: SH3 domain-containing protein [Notoacmeibacter sp.]|nr:SH3 domain-containing protein [Notoacmeibacter sp.]MCC0033317.1 SH3 domain-containing protein [Brucellaceae bacterium]
MTRTKRRLTTVATYLALLVAGAMSANVVPARAGDCTGYVVGVRPLNAYNHARGTGFLAVRSGPGSGYRQTGEVYAGDEISVWDRSGGWYQIACMSGQCLSPLWGPADPRGWVSGRYLSVGGVCP